MREQRYENWLDQRGVKWEYDPAVVIADIVIDDETRMNIRLTTALDEEKVLTYMISLENGAEFPPLMLFRDAGGDLRVVNGLHRLAAYDQSERKETDAYMLQTRDLLVIDTLRRSVNTIEGLASSREASILHALHLIEHGYQATDVARQLSLPYTMLKRRLELKVTGERLAEAGFKPGDFGRESVMTIGRISRQAQFKRVAQLALDSRLSSDDLKRLAAEVREAPDDEAAMNVIETWAEKPELVQARERGQKGMSRPPSSPLRNIGTYMDRAKRIMETKDLRLGLLTPEELESLALRAEESAKLLSKLAKELRRYARRAAA